MEKEESKSNQSGFNFLCFLRLEGYTGFTLLLIFITIRDYERWYEIEDVESIRMVYVLKVTVNVIIITKTF